MIEKRDKVRREMEIGRIYACALSKQIAGGSHPPSHPPFPSTKIFVLLLCLHLPPPSSLLPVTFPKPFLRPLPISSVSVQLHSLSQTRALRPLLLVEEHVKMRGWRKLRVSAHRMVPTVKLPNSTLLKDVRTFRI